jgi:predicted ribosome quality control (RQC) complex YloA/Tae2 family protein
MFGLLNPDKDYRNYRWFFTSNGILVVGGKSDEQNELVIKNFLKPEYTVMHTSKPGSSFTIIQSDNPSKEDLEETAIFCACF